MAWLESVADAWWSWMEPISIQVAALAVGVAVVDRLIRRRVWPQLRVALWMLVIARLVLPPSLSSPVSIAGRFLSSAPSAPEAASLAIASSRAAAPLFLVWLCGVLASGAFDLARYRRLHRALMSERQPRRLPRLLASQIESVAARLSLRRTPRVLVSRRYESPAVFGVLRPCVVVPERLARARDAVELEHVLLHELAHVQRRDLAWSTLLRALHVLYWFHPAVWLARCELAGLRELCCDASVARLLRGRTSGYRATLVRAARAMLREDDALARELHGFVSQADLLALRLRWLEGATWRFAGVQRALALALFAVLLVSAVPMASCRDPKSPELDSRSSLRAAPGPDEVLLAQARERLRRGMESDERQNCLEMHNAALIVMAHAQTHGETRVPPDHGSDPGRD
jgi:beta-lactamase regulating signal transducer with metallopeptidase domain